MAQTPSKRRREGRNDHLMGAGLEDNPYAQSKAYGSYAQDWADGWHEADKITKREEWQKAEQYEQDKAEAARIWSLLERFPKD